MSVEGWRHWFLDRGWSIHMDDRDGQPLDPFVDLARAAAPAAPYEPVPGQSFVKRGPAAPAAPETARGKWITENDLLAALRAHESRRSMGAPHPFSEKWVAEMWFDLPVAAFPSPAAPEALTEDGIEQRAHVACCWCGEHHEEGR